MQSAPYPDVPPDFGHWLAGFIDGEGSFLIESKSPRSEWPGFSCAMRIYLRDDDAHVVGQIVERTGIGVVRYAGARSGRGGEQQRQVAWFVYRKADCLALVALLDRYPLRAKKARDYATWREAVRLWSTVRHGGNGHIKRPFDWTPMARLKERLEAGRRYRRTAH